MSGITHRRWHYSVLLVLGITSVLGCGRAEQGAQQAYERIVFHARTGNEAAFLDGFTDQSQRLIRSLLVLRRTYGDVVDADADPYRSLVMDVVESVDVSQEQGTNAENESVEFNVAVLTVTNGDYRRKISMLETENGWKIDALRQQEMWAKDSSTRIER